jgi:hypothetical protein
MSAKYDVIGSNYAELRKPDRRIAGIIDRALGPAQTVPNVGAGTSISLRLIATYAAPSQAV